MRDRKGVTSGNTNDFGGSSGFRDGQIVFSKSFQVKLDGFANKFLRVSLVGPVVTTPGKSGT
jgi:hypothetical protein